MRMVLIWGMTALTFAAPSFVLAQDATVPTPCAGLATDSFEAAVLNCDEAARSVEPLAPPTALEVLGEAPPAELQQRAEGLQLGGTGDLTAELDGTVAEVVQLTSRAANPLPTIGAVADQALAAATDSAGVQVLSIPAGQRPPPGTCRVWFPDRHSGLQRAPTTCDVEVPEGAVLIRG